MGILISVQRKDEIFSYDLEKLYEEQEYLCELIYEMKCENLSSARERSELKLVEKRIKKLENGNT